MSVHLSEERLRALERAAAGLHAMFEASRGRKRARMAAAPPMQRCDCGREHWRPDGAARCVGCELRGRP